MRSSSLIVVIRAAIVLALSSTAGAQAPAAPRPGTTLRLTAEDAVRMAIDRNVDLAAERLGPQISDEQVSASAGSFVPVFRTGVNRNSEVDPPASLLSPFATRTSAVTSEVGVRQTLPRFGTSYDVSWRAAHTSSNSLLNSFDPILQAGLLVQLSQPLLRDMAIDPARQQLEASRVERDIAATRLTEAEVQTAARAKSAYWNLVSARDNVGARRTALALAEELVRVNKVKVDVGQSPPVDLVSAQAEVAANQEQLIVAETRAKEAEDQLRTLIFDTSEPGAWTIGIDTVALPPVAATSLDLDAAVATALKQRTDLQRARKDIDQADVAVRFTRNQRLPDVRLQASYAANGLGGTELLRTGGFPGQVVGPGRAMGFGNVLNQMFTGQYSTWSAGVTVSYPIGQATEDATFARAKLERRQAEQRLKGAESRAIRQVRDAWRQVEANARRIETTRAARQLAEQRLNDERKRYEVGISTSFLVIQAQRDLAQARTTELSANLAYDLSLVDFETVQRAAPIQAADATATPATVGASR